jgi:hypothetical protein
LAAKGEAAPTLKVCCAEMTKNDQHDTEAMAAAGAKELCTLAGRKPAANKKGELAATVVALKTFGERVAALMRAASPASSADALLKCAGLKHTRQGGDVSGGKLLP